MFTNSITTKKFNNCEEYTDHQVDKLKNKLYTILKNDSSLHRKYVDCEINKLFAEISCDTKHHCVCSNGRNGAKGDIGMTGPKGEPGMNGGPGMKGEPGMNGGPGMKGEPGMKGDQGDSGVSVIPINNTVFVDTQFGTAAGTRENLSNPVQTLQQALAIALPGDTIYVQPGVYLESTLILLNNVNWFFTEGATLIGTSYLFSDGGDNVNSTIEGYGRFISSGGILNITSASNINFNGIFVDISGTVPGFVVSGDSELTLSVDEIVSDTSTVLQITGDTKINWESQTIDTLGSIIVIDSPASGSGNFIVQRIVGGDPTVDSNRGLFYNNSELFDLNIISNTIISNSYNHAVNVNLPATATTGNNTSITVQLLKANGGVVKVESTSGVTQLNNPKISLNASIILIFSPNISIFPVDIDSGTVNIKSSVLYNRGNSFIYVFRSSNNSMLTVDVDTIILANASLLTTVTTTGTESGIVEIFSKIIFIPIGLLLTSSGDNLVTINSDIITVIVPNSYTAGAISTSNTRTTIVSSELTITGNGIVSTKNLIDHVDGLFFMNIDSYVFNGSNINSILTQAGTAFLNIHNVSSNKQPATTFYRTFGEAYLVSDKISLSENAIRVIDGSLSCNISNITTINGNVLFIENDAVCDGYINKITTTTGSVIIYSSTGTVSLTFNEIYSSGTSANVFNLTGNGNIKLKGNTIIANNSNIMINIRNQCELSLNVYDVTSTGVFLLNINTSRGVYLDFMNIIFTPFNFASATFNISTGFLTINGGNITNLLDPIPSIMFNVGSVGVLTCNVQNIITPSRLLQGNTQNKVSILFNTLTTFNATLSSPNQVINLISGEYNIRGLSAVVSTDSTDSSVAFINSANSSSATIIIDTVESNIPIARVSTNKTFWYKTESSTVNSLSGYPVFVLNQINTASTCTVSGYFSTNGDDTIQLNSTVINTTRVISSTLISNNFSINSTAGPQEVIIVPSIAKRPDNNITQIPAGSLVVDINVK